MVLVKKHTVTNHTPRIVHTCDGAAVGQWLVYGAMEVSLPLSQTTVSHIYIDIIRVYSSRYYYGTIINILRILIIWYQSKKI